MLLIETAIRWVFVKINNKNSNLHPFLQCNRQGGAVTFGADLFREIAGI